MQYLVHELMGEIALAGLVGLHPLLKHCCLHTPHRLVFRNTGVGHPIHVALEQAFFFLRRELAIMRHTFVMVVRNEIKNVLFQIGAGARDPVNLILTDHLGQRDTQLGGAHSTRDGHEHLPARVKQPFICLSGINQRCGIEMPVMVLNKLRNRAFGQADTSPGTLGTNNQK